MLFRSRKWLIFLLLSIASVAMSVQSFGDTMQERRVTISASIFPRIIAVDEDLHKKLDGKENIVLGLLYDSDKSKAENISSLLTRKIKKIAGHRIIIKLIDINNNNLQQYNQLGGLLLIEPMSDTDVREILDFSIQKQILCFSPFEGDIERGLMAGIFVGSKIQPYFNLKSIDKAKVQIKPALLRVSKTYE